MKIRVRAELALRIICEMRIGDHVFSWLTFNEVGFQVSRVVKEDFDLVE